MQIHVYLTLPDETIDVNGRRHGQRVNVLSLQADIMLLRAFCIKNTVE